VSEQLFGLILSAAIGIVGILSSLTVAILSNRSAERRLVIQLQHEETKKAIVDLNSRMISSATAQMYQITISEFLNSIESAYLPDVVRKWATMTLDEYSKRREEHSKQLDKSSPKQRLKLEDQFREYRSNFAKEATAHLMHSLTGRRQGLRLAKLRNDMGKIRKVFKRGNT